MKTVTKTSTIPPLRVSESLRTAAEAALMEGETLSAFCAGRNPIQYPTQNDATRIYRARIGGAG